MKAQQLFGLIMWLSACNPISQQDKSYEYHNLKNAFFESIVFSRWGSNQVYVYNEFNNTETRNIVGNIYLSFDKDLNYTINDSVLSLISNRGNRKISKKLIDDDDLKIVLISDTTKYEKYVIFSEPFSINNKWMCFSISRRDSASRTRKHYIFYVEKNKARDQFDTPFIYDWQKDILLKKSVIK
jgi:hypothetical protein